MDELKQQHDSIAATDAPPTLSVRQAADFMGVSSARVNQLRQSGDIPARRAGGWRGWSFAQADLIAYIEREAGVSEKPNTDAPTEPPDIAAFFRNFPAPEDYPDVPRASVVDESPLVRMVNAILVHAIDGRASDIHLEPDTKCCRVRYRVDGRLRHIVAIPLHLHQPIVTRVKVMADLRLFQSMRPQNGSIPIRHHDRDFYLRVAVAPSLQGESMVLHILDREMLCAGQPALGMSDAVREDLGHALSRPGLLLLSGPRGSGLTTTAYSILGGLDADHLKINTLEDVPEYHLSGVVPFYRYPSRGVPPITVADVLRQGPDVLFVGDLVDPASARAAMEAVESGTRVIATIGAVDAGSTVTRLTGFGISHEEIARTITGVLAQRLLPRICVGCRIAVTADPASGTPTFRGAGCDECGNTGVRGCVGVFEFLPGAGRVPDA